MKILYIDTSSSFLYSAIYKNNTIISEVKEEYGQSLSEVTLPKIVEMFTNNNLSPKDVDKIIVVNGPGSFTGIRIGVTIAKVFAWTLKIPITTILSLEAMSISSETNSYHVPIINARRGFVFAAIYDEKQNCILKPQHIKITELRKELDKLGDYEIISNDEFDEFNNIKKYNPNILKIVDYFKDKKEISPHAVNPEYLKLTEAEENNKW